MNKEVFDLDSIESALQKFLFETPTPEEGLMVVLQNPQLLTRFVDNLFESLIKEAQSLENADLAKFYKGRRMLLQALKQALSSKDIALLYAAKLIQSKKGTKQAPLAAGTEFFDFQETLAKLLVWLKAPTLEQGVNILQEYPELLTDRPVKMFGWLMDEARKHGDELFVQTLKTLREFFQLVRLALMEKEQATASKDEITQAVKHALKQTDFSAFQKKQEFSFLA
ncbi:MAG: hypothetical protein DRR08_14190 [Candidatus Parabeggiatoa sp. nov. 2]|nr:MAG: hypothetical protein B6247_18785 [Beggiatoa sp. 4572_84]RKZ59357.1 MAG: hypothetical protein DRR08_14190 [Gammaproteobacteria bacterium]